MARNHVLAIVLASGEGKRLMPLADDRVKPTVPFGSRFRLIDFTLSDIMNSGYLKIVVLAQYESHSLDRHVTKTWCTSPLLGDFIAPVPARQRRDPHWYLGSAGAIYRSLNIVDDEQPEYIVIIGTDNIYRMDFSQVIQHHIDSGLPATIADIHQPIELVSALGVIDSENGAVKNFLERPKNTVGLPGDPTEVLAPMGNYVFTTKDLINAPREDVADPDSKHDVGGDIIPWFVERDECGMYDLQDDDVPGSTDRDHDYWRDVSTLDAYYETNMGLISVHLVFNLYNRGWPAMTMVDDSLLPAKFMHGDADRLGYVIDSFASPGIIVSGGKIVHSVIPPDTYVHSWTEIEDSVVMHGCRIGCSPRAMKVILDKSVVVEEGVTVGVDLDHDHEHGFIVTESGIAVVPKGAAVRR